MITITPELIRAWAYKDMSKDLETNYGHKLNREGWINSLLKKYSLEDTEENRNAIETGMNWAISEANEKL